MAYNPTLGRWMQQDPMGYVDGASLYEYTESAPVVRLDSYGLQTTTRPTSRPGMPGPVPKDGTELIAEYDYVTVRRKVITERFDAKGVHIGHNRAKTEGELGTNVKFVCDQDKSTGKWRMALKYDITMRVTMLPADAPEWKEQKARYQHRYAPADWSPDLERRLTFSHEMDHVRTYSKGAAQALNAMLETANKMEFDSRDDANAYWKTMTFGQYRKLRIDAMNWSQEFDNKWDGGDEYDAHPFIFKP